MPFKPTESPEIIQSNKNDICRTHIKIISNELKLSRRFLQVVIKSVIVVHKKDAENSSDYKCNEPGCEDHGLFTLNQYPDKLIPHGGDYLSIPNFDANPGGLENIGLEYEEIKDLFNFRREISICLDHYAKIYKEKRLNPR